VRKLVVIIALLVAAPAVVAQNLTPAQKDADFRYLASLFSTYYAPVDWKKQLFGFDALDLAPWLDRVAGSATDLDFYELCVEYVASLNDTHDHYTLTSDFSATLGFTADVYDRVLLIDSISRGQLPQSKYPFVIGDEVLSVDDIPVQQYLTDYAKYVAYANPIAARRAAAARITSRPQSRMPHAPDVIGKSATVVIRQQDGNTVTYSIPWVTSGTPLVVGPTPTPHLRTRMDAPDYMAPLLEAQWSGIVNPAEEGINGYGVRNPIFLNALARFNFTRRMGTGSDFYYSGTFKYNDLTIGYIRLPSYSPPSTTTALTQFEQEMAFMNANTDGLIVDEMRNTGGSLCFGEDIAARLTPYPFRATGFQLRPFWSRINSFYNSMVSAVASHASQTVIDQYTAMYQAMLTANQQGMTVTDSLPLCSSNLIRQPLLDKNGALIAYRKPIIMLIDEFSTSTADSVPGMLQDAGRVVLFGMRTNGAGGNNTTYTAGSYSEGTTGMTLALQTRANPVTEPGYPASIYIENVGAWPDITLDYMTKENLLQDGYPFVSAFLDAMVAQVHGAANMPH
jgi:hypothetical protein